MIDFRGDLIIQAVGGVVGAGAGSHHHSEGRLAVSSLTQRDQARIKALFAAPAPERCNFYYRIILEAPSGAMAIEALPGTVPEALIAAIETVL